MSLRAGRLTSCGCLAVLIALLCAAPTGSVRAAGPDVGTEAQRESGKQLYAKYCSQCHGDKGDGEGYAAPHLRPRPRNFTTGKFKVRTTPNGALPIHQDLVNIIRHGMPYTSMPLAHALRPGRVESRVFRYHLLSRLLEAGDVLRRFASSAPAATKESVELGKKLYEETGCVNATARSAATVPRLRR
jgi:cytochrome c5